MPTTPASVTTASSQPECEPSRQFGPFYTASQIAKALGITPQALRHALEECPPDSYVVVSGQLAHTWSIAALPAAIQLRLAAITQAKNYRNIEQLLADPSAPWQPAVPLADLASDEITKAARWREILEPLMPGYADGSRTASEIQASAIPVHLRIFGHPCHPKTVAKKIRIAAERDRATGDWQRLELYMDAPAGRKTGTPSRPASARRFDHAPLADALAIIPDKTNLTITDREFLFDAMCRHYDSGKAAYPGLERAFKSSLLRWVKNGELSKISRSLESLQITFNAKYRLWMENGKCPAALSDQRPAASGNYRRPDFKSDEEKIRDTAILHGGSVSLAHRALRQRGQLSPEFCEHYPFDPRKDKSRVPATLRQQITPDVEMCGPIHRGPHEAKMRGPYIQRDWSGVRPGEWFSADDVTWNSYFWFSDDTGQLQITRGECLLFIDLRTGYPLDFKLIAGKYNGEHIRSAILRVHDLHGLPERGFYFERGVWKSRLITGETNRAMIHWRDSERGLRDHGLDLDLRHATTPRAKTIEGLIRILQERQRSEIGFVGFNERTEKMERVQDIIGRCKRGTEDPRKHFLSMEQWGDQISQCLTQYLADPQNGKMLDGATPAELWAQRQPLCKLPDEDRYLLATHRVRVKVRQEGIILTIRGKRLAFYNEHTGSMIGRDVLAYYNIEQPELLTVSDLNRENFFTVKNHTLPAMSATREQFAVVNKDRAGHMRRAKEIYGNIQHPERKFIVRDNAVDEESKALGRFHNGEVQRFQQDRSVATDSRRKRVERGLELLSQTGPQASLDAPAPKKVYILDPTPASKPSPSLYWALWAKVEKIKPGLSRHALTKKSIGCHPKPQEMTPVQLSKMIEVFNAIIRDAKPALVK